MSRTQLATRENGRHSPVVHLASTGMYYPQPDIAPWLEALDEVPPTPPPKPYRTFRVSDDSYDSASFRKGSQASSSYTGHRPSTQLSISTNESMGLDDSVDDYGQAFMPPELDLPPIHDSEIAPWLDRQEPPSPPPKNGRTFHFPAKNKNSFSSLRPGSASGLFSRQRGPSESHSSLADSAIASTSTSMMHDPGDRSLTVSPELRKTKSSMFSTIRNKVSKRNLRAGSATAEDSEHPSLRPPPLNGSLVFLPVPSPPPTPRFRRPKKKSSNQDDIPPGADHRTARSG
ncbi:hypothetical protein C8F01DRAFT_718830 [Mycena amicta]|nr:hypothetical protein C8F01DRAFT_718830 [Mycena amicta]